jgi:hypothetical protein
MAPTNLKRPRDPNADHDLENVAPDSKAPKKSSNGDIRGFFSSKPIANPPKGKVPAKASTLTPIATTPTVPAKAQTPTPAPSSPTSRDEPKPKAKAKLKPKPKSTPKTVTPQKVYEAAIAKVEKAHVALEKICKKQNPNWPDVTSDHFAKEMAKFIPDVKALLDMGSDGRKCAFDLMLHLGTCVNGDMDWYGSKMSGYGDSDKPYKALDEMMLRTIEKREEDGDVDEAKSSGATTEEVPRRWTEADACVGPYKTGRPNKQQRGWLMGHSAEWKVDRRAKMRERRERAGNWVKSALEELLEQKKYLEDYGLNGYFEGSIKKLEELKGGDA